MITSRRHALVKTFRDAARTPGDLTVIDGWHLVAEALSSGVPLHTVAVSTDARDPAAPRLRRRLEAAGTAVVDVAPAVLDALSPVRTPSGVAALVMRREPPPEALVAPPPALVVVGLDIQDPGNAGALVRAAEAGGATGVVLAGASADPWSWKALRASMGSTFRLPVRRAREAVAACAALRGQGVRLVAAVPHGGVPMHDADLRSALALLVGGEGAGLPRAVRSLADAAVTVPMRAPVESLNVAVAAALLVYEADRQRSRR
ncbi:MAG: RNA methyltransferase [Acidobacteriota bacterium]